MISIPGCPLENLPKDHISIFQIANFRMISPPFPLWDPQAVAQDDVLGELQHKGMAKLGLIQIDLLEDVDPFRGFGGKYFLLFLHNIFWSIHGKFCGTPFVFRCFFLFLCFTSVPVRPLYAL